jgi:hypothetical protein
MILTKNEFRQAFLTALNGAAANAEAKVANPISRAFVIELHAPGVAGRLVGVDEALDRLFLGGDRFYRIIDVAISLKSCCQDNPSHSYGQADTRRPSSARLGTRPVWVRSNR